jgi:hypothetical protein
MEKQLEEDPARRGLLRRWHNARQVGKLVKVMKTLDEAAPPAPKTKRTSHITMGIASRH